MLYAKLYCPVNEAGGKLRSTFCKVCWPGKYNV